MSQAAARPPFDPPYLDRRVLAVLALGFASGLPLALTGATLSAWLTQGGINRADVGFFAEVGTPYVLKFLWAPVLDHVLLPRIGIRFGRRKSWGIAIQTALISAILALGSCDPAQDLWRMAGLAVLVAFLSASQDIVIDAYRIEILPARLQGPGSGAVQTGYRLGMLAAGAGALVIAQDFGWFWAYGAMAALLIPGMIVLLCRPEPEISAVLLAEKAARPRAFGAELYRDVIRPFTEFAARRGWLWVLVFIFTYKLGEAMAGSMAMRLYQETGFSLKEIAGVSKVFGTIATLSGTLLGGWLTYRLGERRALLAFGIAQSLGNLFYVLQANSGPDLHILGLCVFAENFTGGLAAAAMGAFLARLCDLSFTATQFALLSSVAGLGRTQFAALSGLISTQTGWTTFFLISTVITLPALLLIAAKDLTRTEKPEQIAS
jgi:PAT family beta-lactamase induction signal transducer AmpG